MRVVIAIFSTHFVRSGGALSTLSLLSSSYYFAIHQFKLTKNSLNMPKTITSKHDVVCIIHSLNQSVEKVLRRDGTTTLLEERGSPDDRMAHGAHGLVKRTDTNEYNTKHCRRVPCVRCHDHPLPLLQQHCTAGLWPAVTAATADRGSHSNAVARPPSFNLHRSVSRADITSHRTHSVTVQRPQPPHCNTHGCEGETMPHNHDTKHMQHSLLFTGRAWCGASDDACCCSCKLKKKGEGHDDSAKR